MHHFFQQGSFIIRQRYIPRTMGFIRKIWLSLHGMKVGKRTNLPKMFITWPHKVAIGNNCILERGSYFKHDGIWSKGKSIVIKDNVFIGHDCEFNIRKNIEIGNDSLIASGCKFIDHDHGISIESLMRAQHGVEAPIVIGNNVWLGCNVTVLKGVTISSGAVVAAGAVVTKSIPENEIWGGIPAKKLSERC